MIYTYSMLFGFVSVAGSVAIQWSFFLALAIFVRPTEVSLVLADPVEDSRIYEC